MGKKIRDDKNRLRLLLEADKAEMNEVSRAAALADFKRVAEEYFETCGGFSLTAKKDKTGEEVTLTFRITRVKNCSALK